MATDVSATATPETERLSKFEFCLLQAVSDRSTFGDPRFGEAADHTRDNGVSQKAEGAV